MIKRPFFAITKPKLTCARIWALPKETSVEIPPPKTAVFLVKGPLPKADELMVRVGDRVRTGQKVLPAKDRAEGFISTVTGRVSGVSFCTGTMGRPYTSVSVDADDQDQWDDSFDLQAEEPSLSTLVDLLGDLPGAPGFGSLLKGGPALETLVVLGTDEDLVVTKNQFVVYEEAEALKQGTEVLKKISGVPRMLLLVPDYLREEAEKTGVEVKVMRPLYPDTLPKMIMKNLFRKPVPVGKKCEDLGIGFAGAEAVAALAKAISEGKAPIHKWMTVIRKDGSRVHARARIGTPVKDVLKALNIETHHGDRVVLGGAMTGRPAFSEEAPVEVDTDAILVQDCTQVIPSSDSHCVNCGECVRVCPAKMPVNLLIRYLENSLFEEAAQDLDLFSCVECGLCSYVCMVRIPIFQYIMLGKQEVARIRSAEEAHA
mgnify:FL=1